jgi:anti-sigma regulatory factor (Ser/Thr protein kinase)
MTMLGERQFPPQAASVARARQFAGEVLEAYPPRLVQDVQLIVSELTTNCVLHAKTDFGLGILASEDQLRVEVKDRCRLLPVLSRPRDERPKGRGLVITDSLSTAWGVERRGRKNKVVWCSVAAHGSDTGR